jgi:hypothetical protein
MLLYESFSEIAAAVLKAASQSAAADRGSRRRFARAMSSVRLSRLLSLGVRRRRTQVVCR